MELIPQYTEGIYEMIGAVSMVSSEFNLMQQSIGDGINVSSLVAARSEINQVTVALLALNHTRQEPVLTEIQPNAPPEPVVVPARIEAGDVEVFTSSGAGRFQQEVQSVNSMLEQLYNTQDRIADREFDIGAFTPETFQNFNSLAVRISMVKGRIEELENNPMNFGTNTANTQLEQLRMQLNQAIFCQNEMNSAIESMDVDGVNAAYQRLSDTVGTTERYIRDNTDGQGNFNQQISEGEQQANGLVNAIKGAVSQYLSLESIGNILNISDELTQVTTRLNGMQDSIGGTGDMVNLVYAAAQSARGSFSDMANGVLSFGTNAKDAFGSTEEIVGFAALIQKQMTLAGSSTEETSAAMLQLSQALGSGVMEGDALNSIFDQAPNLVQNLADYMKLPIDQVRAMADEGQISADVFKAAVFLATDEINGKFNELPMTWGQAFQSLKDTALIAFGPVLQKINDIANSDAFQAFLNGAALAMSVISTIVLTIFNLIGAVAGFIFDNWSILSPIIYGIIAALAVYGAYLLITKGLELASAAATVAMNVARALAAAGLVLFTGATWGAATAQMGLNGAMTACPILWIILLIFALIGIIFAVCNAIAEMTGIASSGFGVITGSINVVIQLMKNLFFTILNIALGIGNAIATLGGNIAAAFYNALRSVQSWWYDLLSTAMTVIAGICAELNKLPFVNIDYSGVSAAADEYAAKSAEAASDKKEYQSIFESFGEGYSTFEVFSEGWIGEAFNDGSSVGDGIADAFSNFSLTDMLGNNDAFMPDDYVQTFDDSSSVEGMSENLENISGNTDTIAESMELTEEDLRYLREIAEQEAINRYTVAQISIDQSGMQNTIKNGNDLDGFITKFTESINEAVEIIAEGVHA